MMEANSKGLWHSHNIFYTRLRQKQEVLVLCENISNVRKYAYMQLVSKSEYSK